MNKETLVIKEKFLANIDTEGLTPDERLVIASKAFDNAFKCGVAQVTGELAPEAPEGSIVRVKTFVIPDYKAMEPGELKQHEKDLNEAYKSASKANDIGAMLQVLARLEVLNEAKA